MLNKKMQIKYRNKIKQTKKIVKEGFQLNQSEDFIIKKISMHLNMMPVSAEAFYQQAVTDLKEK